MISEDALAIITKVGLVGAVLAVVVPGAIWAVVRYVEFLASMG
jgi:hypothetical protein